MPQDATNKLKKLTDAASKVGKRLATPDDSLSNELHETAKSYDAGRKALGIPDEAPAKTNEATPAPSEKDKVNSGAKYGDKPGEKRLNVDEYTKPLGQPLNVYDKGGDVDVPAYPVESEDVYKNAPRFPETAVMPIRRSTARDYLDRPSTLAGIEGLYNAAGPGMFNANIHRPETLIPIDPTGAIGEAHTGANERDEHGEQHVKADIPSDSMGIIHTHTANLDFHPSGDDINTAKRLHKPNFVVSRDAIFAADPNGHTYRVATLKREKGNHLSMNWDKNLPVFDQGGDVDVNDGKHQLAVLENGEKVLTPEQATAYTVEHPESAHPPLMNTLDRNLPLFDGGGDVEEPNWLKPSDQQASYLPEPTVKQPSYEPKIVGDVRATSIPEVVPEAPKLADIIKSEKEDAAHRGDFLDFGKAVIGENHFAQPTYGGTAHAKNLFDKQEAQKELDSARTSGDPTAIHNAWLNVDRTNKEGEWGQAGSAHPGVLGKFLHGLKTAGNIAGDIFAPATMEVIPGTDLNKRLEREAAEGRDMGVAKEESENWLRKAQADNLQSAADSAKREGTPDQQLIDAYDNLHKAVASGDQKQITAAQQKVDDIKNTINAKTSTNVKATPLSDAQKQQINAEMLDRYKVLHPEATSLPPEYVLGPGATQQDVENHDNLLKSTETAHGIKSQQDTSNAAKADAAKHTANEQTGKVYDSYTRQLDKVEDPISHMAQRSTQLLEQLDHPSKEGDALVGPEVLTIAAGGQGSGLRMNEAEISRIVGGADVWDKLAQRINQVKTSGGTFDDNQREELKKIVRYIHDRASAQSFVTDMMREKMLNDNGNEGAIRRDYSEGRKILNEISRKGIVPEGVQPNANDYVFYDGQLYKFLGPKQYQPVTL